MTVVVLWNVELFGTVRFGFDFLHAQIQLGITNTFESCCMLK